MDKKIKRLLERKIAFIFLRLFALITGYLPLKWSYFVGGIVGRLFYLFVARYRKAALESLEIAFPYESARERKRIAKESIVLMMQSGLEALYFYKNLHKLINIRIEGREYLEVALKKNKGIIGLTAHFGNFPLMTIKLAKEGYVINTMVRPMRDLQTGDYIHNLRTNVGLKTIFSYPRREVVNNTIRALRNNELVTIQSDQNFGTGTVWVDFFGKLAATPPGPIIFALRTEAAVIPMHMVREGVGKHCIKILPQLELERVDDKDETILLNVAKFTKIIEGWIREYPSQWVWIHRRWKSRPSEEVRNARFKAQEV